MSEHSGLRPEVMFFAGPNGSGKSTITRMAKTVGQYFNATTSNGQISARTFRLRKGRNRCAKQ